MAIRKIYSFDTMKNYLSENEQNQGIVISYKGIGNSN
jgi:hypothetical protein